MDDNQTAEPEVVEGELVAPEGAEEILHLTGLINTYISKISTMGESLKKASEMLTDILENDETYQEHSKLAKEAAKVKTQTKQQLLKQPQAQDLDGKMKEAKEALKEMKNSLSEYLTEYARLSGSTEFEDEAGTTHKIVYVARLVKA